MSKSKDEIERKYWTIGAVGDMFGLPSSMIRFWCSEFPILPKRNRRGNRIFTKEDIEVVREIHRLLKVRKFTIAGAKQEMELKKQTV